MPIKRIFPLAVKALGRDLSNNTQIILNNKIDRQVLNCSYGDETDVKGPFIGYVMFTKKKYINVN